MKRLTYFFLFFFLVTSLVAQSTYWTVYHFQVKPGQEDDVMAAMTKFFSSDVGKTLPPANFEASMFSSSKDKWTHQVVFFSEDANAFGEMYSGQLQSKLEFQMFGATMDQATVGVASYLGKSILGEPVAGNRYTTVYELSVSDPGAYLTAFTDLRDAIIEMSDGKLGVQLHSFISGNEMGATHVATISAPDMASMLKYTDIAFSSDAMATFNGKVQSIRKRLRTFSTVNITTFNPPGGM